jgi:hypothetical protein
MDKIEDYIRNNRKDLDKYTPSPDTWKKIKAGVRKGKTPLIWLSSAAMIVVILGTAAMYYIWENKGKSLYSNKEINAILEKTDPHLKETEIYYNNLVNNLYSEATPLLTDYPDIEKELFKDLSEIDSICTDIKKDLKDNIANQEVIEALINNYRIKIRLLEDMLNILKQNENDKEKNDAHAL